MAKNIKNREITIVNEGGTFTTFFKKFSSEKKEYDFEGLSTLRKLLSNEKARLLHVVKHEHPNSIYDLSKKLGRDFKSVYDDLLLLQRFGFITFTPEKSGKRERLKPVLVADGINIELKL